MNKPIRYSIIIPMQNEEEVIVEAYRRLKKVMTEVGDPYELIFVNDGSQDRILEIVKDYSEWNKRVKMIDLSRNFGHQIVITAGMDYAID